MMSKFKSAMLGTVFCAAATAMVVPATAQGNDNQNGGQEGQINNEESEWTLKEAVEVLKAVNALQDGKTNAVTVDSEAGKFEIDILTQAALAGIADTLGYELCGKADEQNCEGKRIMVLGESESFAFGLGNLVSSRINDFWKKWEKLPGNPKDPERVDSLATVPLGFATEGAIGLAGEFIKLARNERSVKTVTSAAVDEQMLVNATAASLFTKKSKVRVIKGSAGVPIAIPDVSNPPDWDKGGQIAIKLAYLKLAADAIPDDSKGAKKEWKSEFESFFKAQTTPPEDGGTSNLGLAISADALESNLDGILRVKLGSQGGSFVTHTNFFTTVIGTDPHRVSGGLAASFTYSHAKGGEQSSPVMWMMITCSTDDMHLDAVRKANFRDGNGNARCATPVKVGKIEPNGTGQSSTQNTEAQSTKKK